MTDAEVALELLKLLLRNNSIAMEYWEPDKLLPLYRKCLATVRDKPE